MLKHPRRGLQSFRNQLKTLPDPRESGRKPVGWLHFIYQALYFPLANMYHASTW